MPAAFSRVLCLHAVLQPSSSGGTGQLVSYPEILPLFFADQALLRRTSLWRCDAVGSLAYLVTIWACLRPFVAVPTPGQFVVFNTVLWQHIA